MTAEVTLIKALLAPPIRPWQTMVEEPDPLPRDAFDGATTTGLPELT